MLWLTNNLVLRDATRGIYLGSTQSIFFPQSRSGGWFEVAAGCTGSVACVMNGPGGLTKSGAGVLELLTNMTYVGSTVVTTGRLVASRATLATVQIDVQNGASGERS
jgi:autotransporter-associated beta strand protein